MVLTRVNYFNILILKELIQIRTVEPYLAILRHVVAQEVQNLLIQPTQGISADERL